MNARTLSNEVDQNYDYFQRNLVRFLAEQYGRFALLRHGNVVGFFDDPGLAAREGSQQFSDDLYSIQEVTNEPTDLGLYSNAVN